MPSGRFAPSPTGRLHLGNLRTAVVAWLYARVDGSRFLLRFEDLDTGSVRAPHYRTQLEDLAALGLDWDDPVVSQSDRLELYRDGLERLRKQDLVYPCFCSRREIREAVSAPNHGHGGHHYPGTCAALSSRERAKRARERPAALRLRAEGMIGRIDDALAGSHELILDDFVMLRNDGTPAYHLAVVVDDAAQGVEVIVRADDLLESACRQIVLYDLLELPRPALYAHVPLVLAPDGARLAKRHGAVDLDDRRARGETPAQVLSFLASSIGLCAPGEPVTAGELLERFDPDCFAAAAPYEPTALPPDFLSKSGGNGHN